MFFLLCLFFFEWCQNRNPLSLAAQLRWGRRIGPATMFVIGSFGRQVASKQSRSWLIRSKNRPQCPTLSVISRRRQPPHHPPNHHTYVGHRHACIAAQLSRRPGEERFVPRHPRHRVRKTADAFQQLPLAHSMRFFIATLAVAALVAAPAHGAWELEGRMGGRRRGETSRAACLPLSGAGCRVWASLCTRCRPAALTQRRIGAHWRPRWDGTQGQRTSARRVAGAKGGRHTQKPGAEKSGARRRRVGPSAPPIGRPRLRRAGWRRAKAPRFHRAGGGGCARAEFHARPPAASTFATARTSSSGRPFFATNQRLAIKKANLPKALCFFRVCAPRRRSHGTVVDRAQAKENNQKKLTTLFPFTQPTRSPAPCSAPASSPARAAPCPAPLNRTRPASRPPTATPCAARRPTWAACPNRPTRAARSCASLRPTGARAIPSRRPWRPPSWAAAATRRPPSRAASSWPKRRAARPPSWAGRLWTRAMGRPGAR